MGQRVQVDEVKAILVGNNYKEGDDLTPFIVQANVMTNQMVALNTDTNYSPTVLQDDATLKEIEKLLAAHFYKVANRQKASETAGRSQAAYMGQAGMGILSTTFGQMAADMDISGTLRDISNGSFNKKTLDFHWIGHHRHRFNGWDE